ncbi:MAG TPA: 16S rRNA (adenine(1518)-N(6)/adenine(1519)-N(6))-dimethyltransferase RsmA [Pirellulales bacterium]|nr:16S rRNA (adenine(1518)-N(6)/adenine(1519)-N(6))-dimethyltransferase RsmA [Pirellulales bacterium]
MTTRNQTISFLRRRLAEVGVRLKTQRGQNFLTDLNLLRLLVQTANLSPNDVVLEVGTGTGALTALVAERVAAVVTVEIDPQLYQLASEELIDFDNVTMLQQDALQSKHTLDPVMLATIAERLAEAPERRFKLVANLPYSVATPLIANLLAAPIVPETMTITIQRELAERIVAQPGTKDYGALSVWVQSQCEGQLVRLMPPEAFWPRPKVTSAIVHLRLDPARRAKIVDPDFFHTVTRTLFLHRRKSLRAGLLSGWPQSLDGPALDKPAVDALLAQLGIEPSVRAEQLDVPTFLRLSEAMARMRG